MRAILLFLVFCVVPVSASEDFIGFSGRDLLPYAPGVLGGSAGAFVNPAAWAMQDRAEMAFYWTDMDVRPRSMDNWGFSLGHGPGFSVQSHTVPGGPRATRYQLGASWGNRAHTGGLSWRWATGDRGLRPPNGLVMGSLHRPNRHVSVGTTFMLENAVDPHWGTVDLGVRPWRKPWVTLFADYAVGPREQLTGGRLGAGVEVRPTEGVHMGFRVWDDGEDTQSSLSLGVTLSDFGFQATPHRRKRGGDAEHAYTSYLVRVNPPHAGLPAREALADLDQQMAVGVIDLEKRRVTYQGNTFFVTHRESWLDLSARLRAAQENAAMTAVAINLSGASLRPSLAWELRDRILRLREAGKIVYVHSDNFSMGKYYVASAADSISMDPMGILRLPGVAFHRTYWKGLLDKLGIGAQEWRLFTHKTAFQRFVREDMSQADREQLGRVADVIYETWREGICAGRGLSTATFENLVNNEILFTPDLARERGLVDMPGTWEELRRRVAEQGLRWMAVPQPPLGNPAHPGDQWGAIPEIAVVYTVGSCDMDEGIRGRATSKYVAALAGKENLAGLVMRVDSPGGDPLPCELINRSVHAVKEQQRPVVVSQGDVAASGGYYLSMPADTILATPMTVTGSIGVIFGWVWDNGFSDKTGFTADGVQRGKSADLFTGIRLPFVPVPLPERNLTPEELDTAQGFIAHEYDLFVSAVARERGLSEEHVRRVAEGRVWMATDALGHGLIDGLGGLEDAVALARTKAGLSEEDIYTVSQYPRASFWELPDLGPGLNALTGWLRRDSVPVRVDADTDYETRYLRLLFGDPGRPMFLVPPAALPEEWSGP